MEQIITKARNEYPKDQTQQFYRIIKPFLDTVFANTNDSELDSDNFIDENNGIKVMRQFFPYNGYRYCFWICLFPNLTPEGKKNAFYGIERQNGGKYSKMGCSDRRHKDFETGNCKFKFDLFKLFDNWYLWIDYYENDFLEAFRLDVIYNQNTSFVLFSNIANDEQLNLPAILKMLMN